MTRNHHYSKLGACHSRLATVDKIRRHSTMTSDLRTTPALLLLLGLCSIINAQPLSDEQGVTPPSASPSTALPEEITITGQKHIGLLRKQVEEAEDLMYGLFNELNDDDRYDIHCRLEAPLGTRIRQRVCRPTFVADADRAVALDFVGQVQGFAATNPPPVAAEMSRHYPILEEKMKTVLGSSPDFADAVVRHHQLREELAQRRTTYFGDDEEE